ncbi:unnamed protein product [Sphenostylis stenocarpa]|uniref:Uncharacterized protein n=1 Tax=Sphenostylis stenocarpa TaxID=92480 RepID=A0AA86VEN8_9FABA|nr:unnamed protein product [Sphenostylis stenocarpa]
MLPRSILLPLPLLLTNQHDGRERGEIIHFEGRAHGDKMRSSAGDEKRDVRRRAQDSKKCADGDAVNEMNTRREH